jgi:hypothetical protein
MIADLPPAPDPNFPGVYRDIAAAFAAALPAFGTQANALGAAMNAIAAGTAQSITYRFSNSVVVGDPTPGFLRLDNAVQNTAANIVVDLVDLAGQDRTATLGTFDDSGSLVKGDILLVAMADATRWLLFSVSGLATPAGYRVIGVANVDGSGASPFVNNETVLLKFTRNGDPGPAGFTDVYPWFGDGSDGNVTISSGTTTLTRNMYYNNLTINGTGSIAAAGYQIFVAGTLDLTAAPAGAIKRTVLSGGNAAGTTAGAAAAAHAEVMAGGAGQGLIGKTGLSGTGNGTAATQAVKTAAMQGGLSGATHTAGAAGGNTGGAAAAKPTAVQSAISLAIAAFIFGLPGALAEGGVGGAGGGSGGQSGVNATSGAGGGGGSGGGVLDIRAKTISRGAGTAASALQVIGGDGGKGGDATTTGSNAGGGSGGAGAGGGFIQIIYETLTGVAAVNCIDVSGGKGGDGGAGAGTGAAGAGADGGDGGAFRTINVNTGAIVHQVSAVTGTAGAGTVGGAGAVQKYNL